MRLATPNSVHMVDEQDRVVHHDAQHHDDADVGLAGERSLGIEEDQIHANQRHRHRQNHAQRLYQGLEKSRGHHVDQQERQCEHHPDLGAFLTVDEKALIPLLYRIARRYVGTLDHVLVDQVTQLRWPSELVRHGSLVLLILPPDSGEDVA